MRILHVNKFFDLHGGTEVYLHHLMRAQEAVGHQVHIFSTSSDRNVAVPAGDEKYFVTRYHLDRREGVLRDLRKSLNFIWNFEAQAALVKMIADLKPDMVHLHNAYHHLSTSVLAPIRAAGLPCVLTAHDYKVAGCPNYRMFTEGAPCERCKQGDYWNAVRHHCLGPDFFSNFLGVVERQMTAWRHSYDRTVNLFICPSRFMQRKMEEWGHDASKLRYLPNPTELPGEPAFAKASADGYILYAGRLSSEKGLTSLLAAVAGVPEIKIKLAGRGPEEQTLRALVREKKITNVEFLGFCQPDELAIIRRQAEAVVLPTLSYENASGALLEAMADGLPCLATRTGGNPELVEDGVNGLLVEPGNVMDWQRQLRRFAALSESERQTMGLAGRERIKQKHLWSQHVEHLLNCYDEVR